MVAGWAHLVRDWPILQIIFGMHSSLMLLHWWYDIILIMYPSSLGSLVAQVIRERPSARDGFFSRYMERGERVARRVAKKKSGEENEKTAQPNSVSMSNSFERHYAAGHRFN